MSKSFCALGCTPPKTLFMFPSRKHDFKRRKLWLDFFDMEDPNIAGVFACEKHFSPSQTTSKGIRIDAVPDIPIICSASVHPFKRKPKNWRTNVIVVTPRDPEYMIYRHETGVFPQNLFNNIETSQPVVQMPIINKVSCSMSSQTNTRFCGLVQISDVKDEYRLNCFYCSEIFPIENWKLFVNHLKTTHFKLKEALKIPKYLAQDHDYTSIGLPKVESPTSFVTLLPATPIYQQANILPPLLAKPFMYIESPTNACIFKKPEVALPPLLPKPHQSSNTTFNISVADQVIKLLNETLLSPQFLLTDEDNILIIKNTDSDNIETSSFLNTLANFEGNQFSSQRQKTGNNAYYKKFNVSKYTRPVYTINNGLQDIPSGRNSLSQLLFPPLPKNKKSKLVQRNIAQQTLKNINVFEHVYKTVKKRSTNMVKIAHLNDADANKVTEQQISKLTPLSRCLKRSLTETTETSETRKVPKGSTEIVFEYTPKDIVFSLLENMENFPVLWEFHDHPFNKVYIKAVEDLCQFINNKWSLNITSLKMKRSLHRILRFYRFMSCREQIVEFKDYFDKCALFLPTSVEVIPRARCAYCCKCFEKDSELTRHIIVWHNSLKWPHKCQICFEQFRERDEYELHTRLPHYQDIFKCKICNKAFNNRHVHDKHVASHGKRKLRLLEVSQPSTQTFPCDICKSAFRTIPQLDRHKKDRHSTQTFLCHLCPKEFAFAAGLKLHLKRHNKEIDYTCEVCGKGFILKSYLNEHMKIHTGAKITCNICNLKLRRNNLLRHLRLVHIATEGTIASTFRAKSHRYKRYFRAAKKRTRTGEGPRHYNCKQCNIPFDRLKHLKDHNKQVHHDVERISCRICTVEFLHLQNLKRHYRCKHKLHVYQVHLLVDQKEDLNKVLAMKPEQLDGFNPADITSLGKNNIKIEDFFGEERMRSDEIQDEIMKAVENLDKQEIKVDDDHSMNDFFTDLLKQ